MLYSTINSLQFDLNVTCNAYCPGCHRHTMVNGEMYMNPFLPFNTSLSIDIVERVMENPRLSDNVKVDFVGLVGEPIAHQQFLEIIDIIYKHRPNARVNIHTNGGLRSVEFFTQLAKKLKDIKTSDLSFSIAPKINAAGRLDDMAIGIKCLIAKNKNGPIHNIKFLGENVGSYNIKSLYLSDI